MDFDGGVMKNFNQTVTIMTTAPLKTASRANPTAGRRTLGEKREIEDFIKGVNINPFINSMLDMSPS